MRTRAPPRAGNERQVVTGWSGRIRPINDGASAQGVKGQRRTKACQGHASCCIQIGNLVLIILAAIIGLFVVGNTARQRVARRDEDESATAAMQRRARLRQIRAHSNERHE